jgi:crotonobetainyl-CoA:carnitine CoA-transferase CaiB-like acyl-CoA transferase
LSGSSHHLPLRGTRVIDLSRALAGPMATTLLADLGADVIKVEPLGGEMVRGWAPFAGETSLYDVSVNRNKRSLTLDFRSPEGRALLRRLTADSDVLVENFRPGVLGQIGIDADFLANEATDLIVGSISGFGAEGPLRDEPCFDQVAQAVGGLMSLTGPTGESGFRVGVPLSDILSGMFTALGICAALAGRGQPATSVHRVETSLLESVIGVLVFQAQRYLSLGEVPRAAGNDHPTLAPYGAFATQDVPIVIAAATDEQWARLCAAIEAPELAADARFLTGRDRSAHRHLLRDQIEARLRHSPARTWEERLRRSDIPVGPVQDMAGVFGHPQVQAIQMVTSVEHASLGQTRVLRGPLRLDGKPVPVTRAAPVLGEHTADVLTDLGLSDAEIDDLASRRIVSQAS